MASVYDTMGMAELRQLIEARRTVVPGDGRYRKNMIAGLVAQDREQIEAKERATREASMREKSPDEMTALEKKLAQKVPSHTLRVFSDDRVYNQVNETLQVRNLPADYTHGWASMAIGGGQDVAHWASRGWIRAEARDCTMDPSDTSKIYVPSFEEYNGYVRYNDCLLMIANRRIIENRKELKRRSWNEKFQGTFGKRGSTGEIRGAITDESGHTLQTTTQWRPEEGLKEGHG